MSDFEYLQKILVGQYLPLKSWLHSRDPRAKLVGFFVLILAVTLARGFSGLIIGIAATFLMICISKIPIRYVLRGLLTPLPFLLILAAIQVFITPHNISSIPLANILNTGIYKEGIYAAVKLIVRFSILVALLTVSSATLSTLEIIHGIELLLEPLKIIGLNGKSAAMVAQITLRFIPVLAINAEKIAKAQASRGADWGIKKGNIFKKIRRVFPLLIPLFNNSLRQAETLADAMLSRAYAGNTKRTSMQEYDYKFWDWIFLLLSVSIAIFIIIDLL